MKFQYCLLLNLLHNTNYYLRLSCWIYRIETVHKSESCVWNFICTHILYFETLLCFYWNFKNCQFVLNGEKYMPDSIFDIKMESTACKVFLFLRWQLFSVIPFLHIFLPNDITCLSHALIWSPKSVSTKIIKYKDKVTIMMQWRNDFYFNDIAHKLFSYT